jgi:hypothetical protein
MGVAWAGHHYRLGVMPLVLPPLGLARSSLFKRLKEWGLGQGED